MFKNKNTVTKVSNAFLIVMLALSLTSAISLSGNVFFDAKAIEGYTQSDYIFNFIVMLIYAVSTATSLIILNRKVDLYKDEYPVSRQIFNLVFVFGILSVVINVGGLITTYFIYNQFSLATLLATLFGNLFIYIVVYIYIKNNEYFSKANSKKTNVINFIVLYLLMEYASNIINSILKLIFKLDSFNSILKSLGLSIGMVCLIVIAYKLINRKTSNDVNVITNIK